MKSKRIFGSWCLVGTLLFILPVLSAPAQDNPAVQAINGILDQFETCFLDEDLTKIESMLAQEYLLAIDDPGNPDNARILTRDQYLSAQARRFAAVDYVEHTHTDRDIEVHGPMAISRSTIHSLQKNGVGDTSRVYHVYAHIDGRWQIVFTSSRLAALTESPHGS